MLKQVNLNSLYGDTNDDSEAAAVQQVSLSSTAAPKVSGKNMTGFDLSLNALLILAQTIFSCLAGVYNEYLLKDKGADVNIFVQNVFMYIDSIVCNILVLFLNGQVVGAFTAESLRAILRFNVIIIIVNNAAIGIVTSFFLKYMNSIVKTFASALELLFTAVLCYFLFAIPIYINTALAIGVVSFAIYLYSQSPVVNTGKVRPLNTISETTLTIQDKRKLLDSDGETDLDMDIV